MATRRTFIRQVGIALASVAMSRCKPPVVTCYVPAETTAIPTRVGWDDTARGRLRRCWQSFDWLEQETKDSWDAEQADPGEDALAKLTADHRAALDELVAAGELEAAVADEVQAAFNGAAHHVWRANAPITCYEPVLVEYTPTSAAQLVSQSAALAELAQAGDLDPETVARVQATIERDVAFLSLSSADEQALYEALIAAAGDSYAFPTFDELELDIPPEATVAARFLVNLLLTAGE